MESFAPLAATRRLIAPSATSPAPADSHGIEITEILRVLGAVSPQLNPKLIKKSAHRGIGCHGSFDSENWTNRSWELRFTLAATSFRCDFVKAAAPLSSELHRFAREKSEPMSGADLTRGFAEEISPIPTTIGSASRRSSSRQVPR